jgi:small-conductance mechanosensitive channel
VNRLFNRDAAEHALHEVEAWLLHDVLSYATLAQAVVILVAFLVALLVHRPANRLIAARRDRPAMSALGRAFWGRLAALTLPIAWAVLLAVAALVAHAAGLADRLITIAISLLVAWIVIRLAASLIRSKPAARLVAIFAWTIAALNIVGLLDRVIAALDSVAFRVGTMRVSVLTMVNSAILLFVLVWAATLLANLVAHRVRASKDLTPSIQVLIAQLFRIFLIVIAVLIAVDTVGIDLSALAVFGGALGVGLGFGLQKIVSNFVSGIILLLDKSIKPGDVIAVGSTYGWIKELRARYVSVLTRDGAEILIPNESLITERVENWSYSDRNVRFKIPIGVSYHSDVDLAIKLCLEAAEDTPRVHAEPKPVCLLKGFGNSSVDLELRIWVSDPEAGRGNVQSEVLLRVWRKFHEHGVEIPFPQRDLHIRSSEAEFVVRGAPTPASGDAGAD